MRLFVNNVFIYLLSAVTCINASIFDYLFTFTRLNTENESINIKDIAERHIPYEVDIIDEKFINEAAKLTGLDLGELDYCQHRVVLKLKTTCDRMNDEQISKMAVMLLNCQSSVEGREIYPCTENMSLRECTSSMNPDVWNTYHIITNRVRAVCYSVRHAQLRGLTEITVNKLMSSAQDQLHVMTEMSRSQQQLQKSTLSSIQSISEGHKLLQEQQQNLQQAQFVGQLALERHIQQLLKEESLIKTGHQHIAKLTEDVATKLDLASKQIHWQSDEQRRHHQQLIEDLMLIQKQAESIWNKIEESSLQLIKQSEVAAKQYKVTLTRLSQVNATINSLFELLLASQKVVDEKLAWLAGLLGGQGTTIEKLYLCLQHFALLIMAMIICSFLNIDMYIRLLVIIAIPLNFVLFLQDIETNLSVISISIILSSLALVSVLVQQILRFTQTNAQSSFLQDKEKNRQISGNEYAERNNYGRTNSNNNYNSISTERKFKSNHLDITENCEQDESFSPLRQRVFASTSRSRSNTPQFLNGFEKKICTGKTRAGSVCRNAAMIGRDYCHLHIGGSSIVQ